MLKKIADHHDDQSLAVQLRRKRFAFFNSLLSRLERPVRILDVGGTQSYWKMMGIGETEHIFVTLLNLEAGATTLPNLTSIAGDAREIAAGDSEYDVVFSNSVIEHVGTFEDQKRMADEVRRVGKNYFVQTPNRYFPIEPHFHFPFFQFFPIEVRVQLLRRFNLGWYKKIPEYAAAKREVESIRLLGKREFARLFPAASLYEEKIFGMTKSFVAYDGWN